jgi:hypothetical protein
VLQQASLLQSASGNVGGRYPSDMTDGEWARLEPLIPAAEPGGRPRTANMRVESPRIIQRGLELLK